MLRGGGVLLLLALGGAWAWREEGGLRGLFAREDAAVADGAAPAGGKYDEDRSKRPKRSREDIQRLAEKWYQELLERHPEMKLSYKDVPDERNGYLQFLNFMDRFGEQVGYCLPLPEDMKAMLDGKSPWDGAAMAKWLEENRALVDEIKAIGLLEEQSVKGIDMERTKFIGARPAYECSKVLLADARLAMERGDEAGAFDSARAVFGLADHLDRMEMPSLLSETISILLRNNARRGIVNDILGGEDGTTANLEAWQGLVAGVNERPADLAEVFLGEWHHSVRSYLLPGLLGDENLMRLMNEEAKEAGGINDPDAVVEAHLEYFSTMMEQLRNTELAEIPGFETTPPDKAGISEEGGKILDLLSVGAGAWTKGWTRSQTNAALYQAAVVAADGGEPFLEPCTGKPFVIDREAGTVSLPEDPLFDGWEAKPVRIPVVGKE